MPKTMPGFCIARTFEGCEHGCGLWMDVSLCSGKVAVPGEVGECVRVHHLCLANYQVMAQLLGLAVLAKILNEQSRRPFRPHHGYGCPTLVAGRRPFCGCRVR